jgi:hypothetical protein
LFIKQRINETAYENVYSQGTGIGKTFGEGFIQQGDGEGIENQLLHCGEPTQNIEEQIFDSGIGCAISKGGDDRRISFFVIIQNSVYYFFLLLEQRGTL